MSPAVTVAVPEVTSCTVFRNWNAGADEMRVRVGSALPVTDGSSLNCDGNRGEAICAWFATSEPLSITAARVAWNSTTSVSPASPWGATVRLPMLTTPVPLVPPVAEVAATVAPAGTVRSFRVPGANMAEAFSLSSSSVRVKFAAPSVPTFLTVSVYLSVSPGLAVAPGSPVVAFSTLLVKLRRGAWVVTVNASWMSDTPGVPLVSAPVVACMSPAAVTAGSALSHLVAPATLVRVIPPAVLGSSDAL